MTCTLHPQVYRGQLSIPNVKSSAFFRPFYRRDVLTVPYYSYVFTMIMPGTINFHLVINCLQLNEVWMWGTGADREWVMNTLPSLSVMRTSTLFVVLIKLNTAIAFECSFSHWLIFLILLGWFCMNDHLFLVYGDGCVFMMCVETFLTYRCWLEIVLKKKSETFLFYVYVFILAF